MWPEKLNLWLPYSICCFRRHCFSSSYSFLFCARPSFILTFCSSSATTIAKRSQRLGRRARFRKWMFAIRLLGSLFIFNFIFLSLTVMFVVVPFYSSLTTTSSVLSAWYIPAKNHNGDNCLMWDLVPSHCKTTGNTTNASRGRDLCVINPGVRHKIERGGGQHEISIENQKTNFALPMACLHKPPTYPDQYRVFTKYVPCKLDRCWQYIAINYASCNSTVGAPVLARSRAFSRVLARSRQLSTQYSISRNSILQF